MPKQYLQTQDIFNKVFQNQSGTLLAGNYYSTQDYLNAVYDTEKNALRIKLDGAMLPAVSSVSLLPVFADINSIAPVVPGDGSIRFFQWNGEKWVPLNDTIQQEDTLPEEQKLALAWLSENLDRVKELASYDYLVQMEELVLSPDTSKPVILNIQGEYQDIDDDGDKDGDPATHYRIDMVGYVLGVETYPDSSAISTDRCYVKIVYESTVGAIGISHIYFEKEEYKYLSNFRDGKNILKIYYVKNIFPGSISVKEEKITFPDASVQPVLIDIQGNIQDIDDDNDLDGSEATHYRIDINGYVLDIEGFNSDEDIQKQRFLTKMTYNSASNITSIYFTTAEYDTISGLPEGKNNISVFYLFQK